MVLKSLIIFLFVFSFTANARRINPYFKKAQVLHKKGQYTNSLKFLRKGYNFKKTKKIPASALFLIGLNYHKLRNHSKSLFYFNRLIKNVYVKKNIRVLRALKKDEVDEIKIPKLLGSTYFYMGQSYYVKFLKTQKIRDGKKSKKYFQICDDSDFNDKCSEFIENIDEKINYNRKKKNSFEFFVYAGRILFQDRIHLEEASSGGKDPIIANNSGICYGAGLRLGSAFKGYEASGCFFSGTASVKNDGGSNNYAQSGVPIAGVLVEGGYYWRFDNEKTRLGVGLPLLYRSGIYSEPEGFSIPDNKAFNYGVMFTAGMQLPYIELQTKLGHMGDTNLLQLNLVYNF